MLSFSLIYFLIFLALWTALLGHLYVKYIPYFLNIYIFLLQGVRADFNKLKQVSHDERLISRETRLILFIHLKKKMFGTLIEKRTENNLYKALELSRGSNN